MAAVAAVQVDDHGGHALERSGARERARVEGAARDERAPRARARPPWRRRRRRRRARRPPPCRPRATSPRASGGPRRPGREGAAAPARRATRDRRWEAPRLFSKRIWLATLRTGVSPIASASSAVVESAADASTESTTRSTPATASAFAAPGGSDLRSRRCRAVGVARADRHVHPGLHEPRGESRAEARRCRRALRPSCGDRSECGFGEPFPGVGVRHQRSSDDRSHVAEPVEVVRVRLVDDERVDQAGVLRGDVCGRRASGQAAPASGPRAP